MQEVRHIIVPKLQELSIKNLASNLGQDPQLAKYLPDNWQKKHKLDREWFLNVVNSLHPGYL